jgi:hypothetical protein
MKKKLIKEEVKLEPKTPTNLEAVTSLADALKAIEACAEKYGATILNDKILIGLNAIGNYEIQLKLNFSDWEKWISNTDACVPPQDCK